MKSTFLRITSVALCLILCTLALTSCSLLDKFINKKDDVPNDTVFEYSGIENFTLESDETDALSQYSSIKEATWKTIIAKDFFIYYQNSDSGTVGAETFVPDTITCKDGKLTYQNMVGEGGTYTYNGHPVYMDGYQSETSDVGTYSGSKIDISIPDHTVVEAYVSEDKFIIECEYSEDGTSITYDLVFTKKA